MKTDPPDKTLEALKIFVALIIFLFGLVVLFAVDGSQFTDMLRNLVGQMSDDSFFILKVILGFLLCGVAILMALHGIYQICRALMQASDPR